MDISEADKDIQAEFYFGNPDENCVEFTQGRDLESKNDKNGLVNFFIYPVLDENGKPSTSYSKEFSFKEIEYFLNLKNCYITHYTQTKTFTKINKKKYIHFLFRIKKRIFTPNYTTIN
ncbi:hypothetical protein QUH73_07975 [Labilibaculum sp. K2S]|uniref:hypothetical protein n=1 Tax=Labilibaculum sp. K2S TaxID=3056386 RepID=UPI0025A4564B|nr:hypothetical protein [Labilibaculum sp. K2S]MDM8159747.1 hypothetical protein [Labilibaculum sp. K2S]